MEQSFSLTDLRAPSACLAGLRALASAWSSLAFGVFGSGLNWASPAPIASTGGPKQTKSPPASCAICGGGRDAARRELVAAQRAKSQFLATVSHELRTPLNAIIGFSQVIRDDARKGGVSPLHADFVEEIYASGVHLMELVDDMLELASIESGRRQIMAEPVDIAALLDVCRRGASASADAGGVTVAMDIAHDVGLVVTDWALTRRMVLHLLSNGVKFTPPGGRVDLMARPTDWGIEISVRDTGVGMSADDLNHVFDPFWQATDGTSRAYGGAGLGLTLAKAAAELLGGDIRIDSAPGKGTDVRVGLPLRLAANGGTVRLLPS